MRSSIDSGYTLVEVIVVMVLVGLLSVAFLADFTDSQDELQVDGAARKIAADLRYARNLAVSNGRDISVYFNQSDNQYRIVWGDGETIDNPSSGENFVVSFGAGNFGGVAISATALSGGRLDFSSSGQALNAGSTFSGALTVANLNNQKSVLVYGGSGLIKIN